MSDLQKEMEKWAKENGVEVKASKPIKKKKSQETFSRRELQELMNTNQPTYHRGSGGAIRQR